MGEQLDPNVGLYYNRARWYDAKIGRFASVDPFIGHQHIPVSLHKYLYGNASPLSFYDPSGRFSLATVMATSLIVQTLSAVVMIDWFPEEPICPNITFKRNHINPFGEDKYGHWWVELYNSESYGWWPKYSFTDELWISLLQTMQGVEGELNGTTDFGGMPTLDPHHGDDAQETFNPRIKKNSSTRDCLHAFLRIRQFVHNFSRTNDTWSWPGGPNCQTFQKDMMNEVELVKP